MPESWDPVLERDLPVDLSSSADMLSFTSDLRPDSDAFGQLCWTGMYVSSHYGGLTEPFTTLCDRFLPNIPTPIESAADLGCGPGRMAMEIAHRTGGAVVGLDVDPLVLRWAQLASRSQEMAALRLRNEASFELKQFAVPVSPAPGSVRWVCADVRHPPLVAESFDLVTAINLLDSVHDPYVALGQAAAILRPGGHLILAQPDAWSTTVADPDQWLAVDDAGWDRVLAHFGLRVLHKTDSVMWEMARTPRHGFWHVLHGRLAVKRG